MMTEPRYRRAPHLVIEWDPSGRLVLTVGATGRQLRVSPSVVSLLDLLSDGPMTADELGAKLGDEACPPGLLQQLHRAGLLTVEDEADPRPCFWSGLELAVQRLAARGGPRHPLPSVPAPAARKDVAGPAVALPRPDRDTPLRSLLDRRVSSRSYGERALGVEELGAFLFTAARVIGPLGRPEHQTTHRPYPSAGARHSLEVYALCERVHGLPRGAYHYCPWDHRLIRLDAPGHAFDELLRRAAANAGGLQRPPSVVLHLTSVTERVMWKYERMGLLAIYRDVGCLMQTMYLVATDMGLRCCAVAGIEDSTSAELIGCDPLGEVHVGSFLLATAP